MRRKSVRFRSRVLRKMHCYPAAVADTVAHAHTAASPIQHGAVRPCLQQRRGTLLADGLSFKQQPPRTNISRITAASGRLPCSQQQLPWTSGCGALLAAPPAATPPAASHRHLTQYREALKQPLGAVLGQVPAGIVLQQGDKWSSAVSTPAPSMRCSGTLAPPVLLHILYISH